jgi:ADP-ribosylation factor-like protein 8
MKSSLIGRVMDAGATTTYWDAFLRWLRRMFFGREMEIVVIGLQNAGKTSFVDALGGGVFEEDMIPTVGFNMRKLSRDGVSVKTWDLGGQERFRGTWERYCRGVDCVVYVVDASAPETFETARNELHGLLKRETLGGIPLLVLGNKCDLEASVRVQEVVEAMELKRATGREVCCYNVSCKDKTNLSVCLKWLTAHAK